MFMSYRNREEGTGPWTINPGSLPNQIAEAEVSSAINLNTNVVLRNASPPHSEDSKLGLFIVFKAWEKKMEVTEAKN